MSATEPLVTAEEFARMPESTRYRYELVEGRLVRMSPVNFNHGKVVLQVGHLLKSHLDNRPAGVAVIEAGFTLASNPDTVRGPDVSFVRQERVPARGTRGFPRIAPDAVFEVLSPGDRASEVRKKTADYLDRGVHVVVIIDPAKSSVVVHRAGAQSVTLRDGSDVLDLSDAIPGFTCTVSEIFE